MKTNDQNNDEVLSILQYYEERIKRRERLRKARMINIGDVHLDEKGNLMVCNGVINGVARWRKIG